MPPCRRRAWARRSRSSIGARSMRHGRAGAMPRVPGNGGIVWTMSKARPPGPRGYPILGVLPQLRSDPIRVFLEAADRYGDLVYLRAGVYPGYLLSNPGDIKHVLQDNYRNYHKS